MRNKILGLIAFLLIMWGGPSVADNTDPCSHPVFVTHACLDVTLSDLAGQDGSDGQDGVDGIDGADGVIPTGWYEQLQKNNRYSLATDAIQMYLPDDGDSRVTFGVASAGGSYGAGLGYAFVADRSNRLALTLGLGMSAGETAFKGSIGFEF